MLCLLETAIYIKCIKCNGTDEHTQPCIVFKFKYTYTGTYVHVAVHTPVHPHPKHICICVPSSMLWGDMVGCLLCQSNLLHVYMYLPFRLCSFSCKSIKCKSLTLEACRARICHKKLTTLLLVFFFSDFLWSYKLIQVSLMHFHEVKLFTGNKLCYRYQ